MYDFVLLAHSWLRWLVLLAALAAVARAIGGVSTRRPWTPVDDRAGAWLTGALDLQMLLGLILYFVASPNMQEIRAHFGEAMKNPQLRFWAVEHVTAMMVAVVLVHVGRVLARKAATPAAKRTRLLICFGIATVAVFLGTPWPGMAAGRPLFRV